MAAVHPGARHPSIGLQIEGVSRLTDPILFSGEGAPSGAALPYGQTLDSGQAALYFRRDGTASTFLYVTIDGGSTWTACDPAALSSLDLNGTELILDADGDTSITADTDDQVDVKIAGADDFRFVANIFRALSGSVIETNTINETTSAAGVTIDGVLVKDGGIVCADAATLEVDTVNEATAAAGVTVDGVLIKDGSIVCADGGDVQTDTVTEATTDAGVTVEGTHFEDGLINSEHLVTAVIAVADAGGGGTTAALTVDLYMADETQVLGRAVQIMIATGAAQYAPRQALNANATFGTATKGTIVASGAGWCLAETDADGEFDCTVTNAADEAVYFWVESANKLSDPTDGCVVLGSNSDLATWSA